MQPPGVRSLICEYGDCTLPEAAQRLAARFRALVRDHWLTTLRIPQRVQDTLSGCLGVCAGGPILVVSHDGTWYYHMDEVLLEWIIAEHLLAGQPVEAPIFHHLGADSAGSPVAASPVYAPHHSGDADDTEQAPALRARRRGCSSSPPAKAKGRRRPREA
jgi:(2Fe-2S) ferredoxin